MPSGLFFGSAQPPPSRAKLNRTSLRALAAETSQRNKALQDALDVLPKLPEHAIDILRQFGHEHQKEDARQLFLAGMATTFLLMAQSPIQSREKMVDVAKALLLWAKDKKHRGLAAKLMGT